MSNSTFVFQERVNHRNYSLCHRIAFCQVTVHIRAQSRTNSCTRSASATSINGPIETNGSTCMSIIYPMTARTGKVSLRSDIYVVISPPHIAMSRYILRLVLYKPLLKAQPGHNHALRLQQHHALSELSVRRNGQYKVHLQLLASIPPFSIRCPQISPKNNLHDAIRLGQRDTLSSGDVAMINRVYCDRSYKHPYERCKPNRKMCTFLTALTQFSARTPLMPLLRRWQCGNTQEE